ncbi:hypothetical protein [Glutamicibacter sp.]|uniref:hypothetical protein n=1 Tax=Glutamicibacter sp. TaxID=1931995 RepID=UPI003D6BDC97
MSNLGGYQMIVTFVKGVGGPKKAGMMAIGAATALYAAGVASGPAVKDRIDILKEKFKSRSMRNEGQVRTFVVRTGACDDNGLKFEVDDQFLVLECDDDSVLIELLGSNSNPHIVSGLFLANISAYPAVDLGSEA